MKPCFNEDELLNLCTDPIEICHEQKAEEIKLVRLDGIKVGYFTWLWTDFHARQIPGCHWLLSPRATETWDARNAVQNPSISYLFGFSNNNLVQVIN